MLALHGVGVLVTRPASQAASLCQLLEQRGASAWHLPALEIVAAADAQSLAQTAATFANLDLVIFTSVNSIRFGAALLPAAARVRDLAAIGPATSRALFDAGLRPTIEPTHSIDSEGLLAHARLARVGGQRVLIVKGRGGRGVLEAQLRARGALVSCADVYERQPAQTTRAQQSAIERHLDAGEIQVETATSKGIVEQILRSATPAMRAAYEHLHWLIPSARIGDSLRRLGCGAPLLQARSAVDQDLVSALETWRGGGSAA